MVLRGQQQRRPAASSEALFAPGPSEHRVTLSGVTLDPNKRQLYATESPGQCCQLTEKEAQLMQIFMQSCDQTISRADAFYRLYHYEMEPENRSIDVLVTKLRKKIAQIGLAMHIQSLRGQGYRLILELQHNRIPDEAAVRAREAQHELAPLLDASQLQTTLDSTDPELQRDFYEIFLGHVSEELQELGKAETDVERLRALAHQLKSSSQSIGAPRFTQVLVDLEAMTQSAGASERDLRMALKRVMATWRDTAAALTQQITALESS